MAPTVQSLSDQIRFFNPTEEGSVDYTFVIIVTRYQGQWIWVRHRDRTTWELPAGHLEPGEDTEEAARRELFEETGALDYSLNPIVAYEGRYRDRVVFGMIFRADVVRLGPLPEYEIAETRLFSAFPEQLTYPDIQKTFFQYATK